MGQLNHFTFGAMVGISGPISGGTKYNRYIGENNAQGVIRFGTV